MHCSKGLPYSVIPSALASSDGGTARPSIGAVCTLMSSSNLIGVCTGGSAGLSPLKSRATYTAVRRNWSRRSTQYDASPPMVTKKRKGKSRRSVAGRQGHDLLAMQTGARV